MVLSCWQGLNHNGKSKCFLPFLGSANNSEECCDLPAEREMLQVWLDPSEILVPLWGINLDLSCFLQEAPQQANQHHPFHQQQVFWWCKTSPDLGMPSPSSPQPQGSGAHASPATDYSSGLPAELSLELRVKPTRGRQPEEGLSSAAIRPCPWENQAHPEQ